MGVTLADRITKVTLLAQVSGYVSGLQQAKKATDDTASAADQAKAKLEAQSKLFDATGKAAVAFGAAAAIGVGAAIKAYADWNAKMAQVQSLSHANTSDMQALSSATFDYATKFGISASQAADAEIELVKGGVSVKDMINGGLTGALTLATAGQIDVGDATSIAVSAMTQFHLKGQDVSHIADLLAAGADKALGSVSDLGEGLKYVGPVASSMGVSIEQTVGTLSELAQNGILADQAGTGLRGMLSSLTSPSQQAATTMQQFGINVYNAQGKFIGFDGVAQQLKTHLGDLDEATRNQALGQIFGNQQITAATVLMQGGAASVDKWTKAVNDQGFAAQQASGKMDSLTGNWTRLSAAVQNDLVQTGSAAGGPLNAAVVDITKLATAYGNMSQPMKDAVFYGTAAASVIGLVGGAAILAVPKIVAFDAAIAAAGGPSNLMVGGLKSVASFMTGPWGLAMAAGAVGVVGLKVAMDAGKTSAAEYQNALSTGASAAKEISLATAGFWNATGPGGQSAVIKQFDDLDTVLDRGAKASHNFFYNLGEDGNSYAAQKAIKDLGSQLGTLATTNLPAAQKEFQNLANTTDGSTKHLLELLNNMPAFKTELTNQATQLNITASKSNLLKLAMGQLGDASSDASAGASDAASSVDQVQQAADDASSSVDDLVKSLENLDNGNISASEAQVAMAQAVSDATDAVKTNGRTLDDNTQKGRDNRKALDNIASSALSLIGAQEQAGASTDTLSKSTASARSNFISVAEKMGLSASAASGLANQYGLIPSEVVTTIATSGAPAAVANAAAVKNALDSIPTTRHVEITVSGDPTATSLVTRGSSVIAHANGGIASYYANGGFENHVAQIAPAGAMRLWAEPETGGESYIPLAPSKRSRSIAIWEETGRRLQAFAGGGFSGSSVTVASPSLDGLAIGGRLEIDATGLVQLVDGRIYTHAKADARTIRNGRRRH